MCDRPSESSSDDLKMHCLLFSFSPMLRTNSQQLNLHRHIYLSCKAQRNPALQYNIDCEIYQYLPARRLYQGARVSQPLHNVCFEKAETIRSTLLRIVLVFFETDIIFIFI